MADEAAGMVEPQVNTVIFDGKLTGSFGDMASAVSGNQLFGVSSSEEKLIVFDVETRDMQKRPLLFFIITFRKDSVELEYSLPKDTSEKLRKLSVLRGLMGVLSMVAKSYSADQKSLLEYVDGAIDDVIASMSQGYSTLFNSYDSLLAEHRELRRLNLELASSNKGLTADATRLSRENEELASKLKALENYSDESLMVMIQEWIESHNGTIDISEFAKTYKITQPRVEQILNRMVASGFIELKG